MRIIKYTLCKPEESKEKVRMCVNLYVEEEFSLMGKILVNYIDFGFQVILIDGGAPFSFSGLDWLKQYLAHFILNMK